MIVMDIIGIEADTYERTFSSVENFLNELDALISKASFRHTSEWLDNQEVCIILKISPRALQNLRSTGQISYSQFERRIYYKREDVQSYIEKHCKA